MLPLEQLRRDPDHILELQVVASELQKEPLSDEDFHMIRSILNGKCNIESRGVKFNRYIKGIVNRALLETTLN